MTSSDCDQTFYQLASEINCCSSEVLELNWSKWFVRLLRQSSSSSACACINILLNRLVSTSASNVRHEFVSERINPLLDKILSFPHKAALHCLVTLMRNFAFSCRSRYKQIMDALMGLIDFENNSDSMAKEGTVMFVVAKNLSLLPSFFGNQAAVHWEQQFIAVVIYLHQQISLLYEGTSHSGCTKFNDLYNLCASEGNKNDFADYLSSLSPQPLVAQIAHRVQVLLHLLRLMLEEPFAIAVEINPFLVMQLCECVCINSSGLRTRASELNSFLCDVHVCALMLICSLAERCGLMIAIIEKRIADLLLLEFQWTEKYFDRKAQHDIRTACYQLIKQMALILGSGFIRFSSRATSFLPYFLFDLQPLENKDKAVEDLQPCKNVASNKYNRTRRKRRKDAVMKETALEFSAISSYGSSNSKITVSPFAPAEIESKVLLIINCCEAIAAFLNRSGTSFTVSFYRDIQNIVISCLWCQDSVNSIPYYSNETACMDSLLSVFITLLHSNHPNYIAPVQSCMQILEKFNKFGSHSAMLHCLEAYVAARSIIRPQIPSLETLKPAYILSNEWQKRNVDVGIDPIEEMFDDTSAAELEISVLHDSHAIKKRKVNLKNKSCFIDSDSGELINRHNISNNLVAHQVQPLTLINSDDNHVETVTIEDESEDSSDIDTATDPSDTAIDVVSVNEIGAAVKANNNSEVACSSLAIQKANEQNITNNNNLTVTERCEQLPLKFVNCGDISDNLLNSDIHSMLADFVAD